MRGLHSGTNGYIQKNLSNIRPRDAPQKTSEDRARPVQPDATILAHNQKRKVEIACLQLQDELEDQE